MLKRSWVLLLPLVAALLWSGAQSAHASGEMWKVLSVNNPGCASIEYNMQMQTSGLSGSYLGRTTVTSGGLTYEDDETAGFSNNSTFGWNFVDSKDYGGVTNPGTWPIPAGQQVKAVFRLEEPKGTVRSSWTFVIASCDSTTILYNGPTEADLDEDFVATPTDLCPALKSFTANGCPVRDRSLTLKAKSDPRRVVGKLYAAGYPELQAGRTVEIWKKRPGPDRLVANRTTDSMGKFKAKVRKGRYYATSPGFIAAASGEALADISNRVRVR
jgi:hypothetical protein